MKIDHPTWMEIDSKILTNNWKRIRKHIGKRLFSLPVKANGYGHGIIEVSKLAQKSKLIDYLGVSCSDEALILRKNGIKLPIHMFGAFHESQIKSLIETKSEITISSLLKAELLLRYCQEKKTKAKIHLEIETGTNRTGMKPETALKVLELLSKPEVKKHLILKGIYTHLASAGDGPNKESVGQQLKEFEKIQKNSLLKKFDKEKIIFHTSNSGGIMFYPESYKKMQMVRPGILAYGLYDDDFQKKLFPEIKRAISLKSKVSFFKVVEKDSGIGYGHTYKTKEQTRIITVPIGYGDGYLRGLSHKASIILRGKRYPIVGTINMDQFMVDIGPNDEAYVGDEVVLIGRQGDEVIEVTDLANWAQTITYEILCALNQRVKRIYL